MLRVHCVVPEIQSGKKNHNTNRLLLVAGNPRNQPTTHLVVGDLSRVTAVIAKGKRPVPFRTRKLSPSAPMVLHWERCGRVGRRRTNIHQRAPPLPGGGALWRARCRAAAVASRARRSSGSGCVQTACASERAKRRWSSVHHCAILN